VSIAEVKKNAKFAQELWDEFENEHREMGHINETDEFKKNFHLRPTSKGATIVTTMDILPMNGIVCESKKEIKEKLKDIYHVFQAGKGTDIKAKLMELGFPEKGRRTHNSIEVEFQAEMISGMSDNVALKEKLQVNDLIFLASEFILQENETRDGKKIDIIGYNGDKRLFFFEVKRSNKPSGKGDVQVEEYVNVYGQLKRNDMMDVLTHYPINAIRSDVSLDDIEIEGYAVWGYGDEIESFAKAEGLKKEGNRFTGNRAGKIIFSE